MKFRSFIVATALLAPACVPTGFDDAASSTDQALLEVPQIGLTPRLREQRAECGFAKDSTPNEPRYASCYLAVTVDEVRTWLQATRSWVGATRELYLNARGQLLTWATNESRLACAIKANSWDASLQPTLDELAELFKNTYGRPYDSALCRESDPAPSLACDASDMTPRCSSVRAWSKLDRQYRDVADTAARLAVEVQAWDFGFTERCTSGELANDVMADVLRVASNDADLDPRPVDAQTGAPRPAKAPNYRLMVADDLFTRREDVKKRRAALCHYDAISDRTTAREDVVLVRDRLARLHTLDGLDSPTEGAARVSAFSRCIDAVAPLKPAQLGTNVPEYFYWTAYCLAQRASAHTRQAGDDAAAPYSRGERDARVAIAVASEGRRIDETFEGGGMFRVLAMAQVACRNISLSPTLSCPSDETGWSNAQRAIVSPAYGLSRSPDTDTGNYFYDVYASEARIAVRRWGRASACSIVAEPLARIDSGDATPGREPETLRARRALVWTKSLIGCEP